MISTPRHRLAIQIVALVPPRLSRHNLVLTEAAGKDVLARTIGSRLAEDRRRDGDADAAIRDDVERSYRRIVGAGW